MNSSYFVIHLVRTIHHIIVICYTIIESRFRTHSKLWNFIYFCSITCSIFQDPFQLHLQIAFGNSHMQWEMNQIFSNDFHSCSMKLLKDFYLFQIWHSAPFRKMILSRSDQDFCLSIQNLEIEKYSEVHSKLTKLAYL